MKTLIFGCGYLGRRVASAWTQSGHEVFAMTRSAQNAESFRQRGIRPLVGDVCDPESLQDLPTVDAVLYAVGFDRNSGTRQVDVTCGGIQNVLTALRGRYARFIHISSTSVYGQSTGEWVNEDSDCHPTQVGGELNLAAEQLVRDRFCVDRNASINVLRLAGIYGPGRLLSRIDSLLAGVLIAGRGDSWLNLIHVDDAAAAVIVCAERGAAGAIYNIVDDQPIERSVYFGLLAQLVKAPVPKFDSNRPGARGSGGLNKRCSNRKFREELGWSPGFPSIFTGLPASLQ